MQTATKKKKLYEFALLAKRPPQWRADLVAVSIITSTLFIYFGWELTNKEDLLAMASVIMAALVNGVLLLCNYWSVAYHETIAYQKLEGN